MIRKLTASPPERVLVVRLSSIGDTLLTTPLLAAIKDRYPDCEVDWVVGRKSQQIVEMCEGVSRVFTFPKLLGPKRALQNPSEIGRFISDLSGLRSRMLERRYDLALDVQGLLKSGVAIGLSGARVKVGWSPPWSREVSWIFTDIQLQQRNGCHVVDAWLDMLDPIGCRPQTVRFPVRPPDDAFAAADQFIAGLRRRGPLIVMNMGASTPAKCWPAEKFAQTARIARDEMDAASVFTWGSSWEYDMAVRAQTLSEGAGAASFKTTLFTLAALLQRADAYLGADTGPTHLAAALRTPCVALFGITNPARVRPYGEGHVVLSRYNGGPNDRTGDATSIAAMQAIEPLEVVDTLGKVLGVPVANGQFRPQ